MGNSKSKTEKEVNKNLSNEELSSSSQLQIRSCIRNTRGSNGNHFDDVCPNEANTASKLKVSIRCVRQKVIIYLLFIFGF